MPVRPLVASLLVLAAVTACKREERDSRPQPVAERAEGEIVVSGLHPGGPPEPPPAYKEYEESAYHVSQGEQLYNQFECVGCHSHGGGGMGPPLMDEKWIYGSRPEQIFSTIVEGRPNGMPSFRGKIPDYQVWELAAYVRSMAGLVSKDVAPARDDAMSGKQPESSTEKMQPKPSGGIPKSAEMPQ
jgi:cytochrome c oxidase cbb3-type subunit 3